MGYILKLQCYNCDYEKIVHLGAGKKDFDNNKVANYFDNRDILDLLSVNHGSWMFNWRLAQCKQCNEIFRVPTVMCIDEQGQKKELAEARCVCGSNVCSLIGTEEEHICCNQCSQEYHIEKIGLWD